MYAFKGFERDLKCRGFQYEPGKLFKLDAGKAEMCVKGFHACVLPIHVFHYYESPIRHTYRFVNVQGLAPMDTTRYDSKICGSEIFIGEERVPDIIKANFQVVDRIYCAARDWRWAMTPTDAGKFMYAWGLLEDGRYELYKETALNDADTAEYISLGFWRGLCLIHDTLGETSACGDFNHFLELMTSGVKELFV